jgi:RND family efflux transporter MFP subunit
VQEGIRVIQPATQQRKEVRDSEPGQVRLDRETTRLKLGALQIDKVAPRRKAARWIAPLIMLVALVLLLAAYLASGHSIRETVGAWRLSNTVDANCARASVGAAGTEGQGVPILTASGYIVARREAVISAKIQGLLTEMDVDVGSSVVQGQVIARLQSAEFDSRIVGSKAAIQVAQDALDENRRQLKIADELANAQVWSRDQRDAATSRVNASQAALALAQADLATQEVLKEDTVIRAPFSGMVVKKMAEVGESVAPIPPGVNISTSSGAIVAVADIGHLEVEVDVGESSVEKLRAGIPAEIMIQAFSDHKYHGLLRQLVPTADRTKGTVQAKVAILDATSLLKPEMTAQVTFLEGMPAGRAVQSSRPVVTVPQQALTPRGRNTVSFEVLQGIAHERVITTGEKRGDQVAILQGLTGQELLVLSPPLSLRDGDSVHVLSIRGAQ